MSTRLSGNSLFASAASGLSSSYYYLSLLSGSTSGLTLENILHPDSDSSTSSAAIYLNSSFAQYLAKNFNTIDADGDGTISSSDIQSYTTKLYSSGLTYNQIAQLCSEGSSSLYETVLNNFSEIDVNCDGKVTSAEISAYGIQQEKEEMEEKYPKYDLNAMSIFYDTSDVTTASTSTEDVEES